MLIRTFPALALVLAAAAAGQPCDPVWSPLNAGTNEEVLALAPFHGSLYVGGSFTGAGEKDALRIARWDGHEWFPLDGGISGNGDTRVNAVLGFGDGGDASVFVAGYFSHAGGVEAHHIARWDGEHWHDVGGGLGEPAYCLASWDDGHGPSVYVGGNFNSAGGVEAHHIARWDGEHWSALASGLDGRVLALAVYDAGNGESLYAGGEFLHSGDQELGHIARWNNHEWVPVGGADAAVYSLFTSHHFGEHPTLFAGGEFTHIGGVEASHIARWNGEHWTPLGGGVAGVDHPIVTAIAEFDDSHGVAMYAGGYFTTAGEQNVHHIARWNGEHWSSVGDGLGEPDYALAVYEGGPGVGAGLFAGGDFHKAGNADANYIARWGCVEPPPPPCYADINGDGVLDLFDFLGFVNLFNDHSDHADCDHNGVLDLFDFLCFVNAFNDGC